MTLPLVPLEPLERGYLTVLRVRAAIGALILLVAAALGDVLLLPELGLAHGWIIAPAAAVAVWTTIIAPPRRWRRWGYAFTGRELHVARGWLFRAHTIVPVVRVQHIDVAQGPIERGCGVATLVLHTAGTDAATVALPGITRAGAEEIRDAIRAQLTERPW